MVVHNYYLIPEPQLPDNKPIDNDSIGASVQRYKTFEDMPCAGLRKHSTAVLKMVDVMIVNLIYPEYLQSLNIKHVHMCSHSDQSG